MAIAYVIMQDCCSQLPGINLFYLSIIKFVSYYMALLLRQDLDLHRNRKSDRDPDRHQKVALLQHWRQESVCGRGEIQGIWAWEGIEGAVSFVMRINRLGGTVGEQLLLPAVYRDV